MLREAKEEHVITWEGGGGNIMGERAALSSLHRLKDFMLCK